VQQSETIDKLAPVLVKALGALENPTLDATNPHFRNRYTQLATLLNHVRPALAAHGLAILQAAVSRDGGAGATTRILHTSGQWIEETFMVAPGKADPQGYVGAVTYAKRCGLQSLLGICGEEDDDGNAISTQPQPAHRPTQSHATGQAPVRPQPPTQAPKPAQGPAKAAPAGGSGLATITIAGVETFPTKNGGTRYVIKADGGQKYKTFSDSFGSAAQAARESGAAVAIAYVEDQWGLSIESIQAAPSNEPGADLEADAEQFPFEK
jgi:hypothetical protein